MGNAIAYLRARRVAAMFDISVATVWRWSKEGRLPAPHRLSPGVTAWRADEIAARLDEITAVLQQREGGGA